MRQALLTLSLALLLLTVVIPFEAQDVTASPIALTKNGRLQGRVQDGLTSFKGVRYAQPPVGNLRWRAPQALAPWTGTHLADQYGPACAQRPMGSGDSAISPENSEDCLTLDIWAPAGLTTDSKAAVMVNIFGGGFITGTPSSAGSELSGWAREGVIAVGINYRLGNLGWFAYPELTREQGSEGTGNFGLMDQVAALRWVRDNIRAFGGNPNNITVLGSSAGAISVNMILLSPQARGLFAQAATVSGFGRQPAKSLSAAESEGIRFAQSLGASSLAELRALSVEKILSLPPQTAGNPMAANSVGPIIDGVSLPEDIFPGFLHGHEAKVPWIVGSASFDASNAYLLVPDPEKTIFRDETPAQKAEVMKLFNPDGTLTVTRVAQEILTERIANEPARELAASHAKLGAPTYGYFFAYVPTGDRSAQWGATHGEQNAFFQNNFTALKGPPYTPSPADVQMAGTLSRYFTAFAKTGMPAAPGAPRWSQDTTDDVLVIDNAGIHMKHDHLKRQLDFIEHLAEQHPLP